jgi:hypothetical protein
VYAADCSTGDCIEAFILLTFAFRRGIVVFNKPIVLVVGAGASFDTYGLPLGSKLASDIAETTDFYFANYSHRPTRGDADFYEGVIWRKFNSDRDGLNRYTAAGQRLAAALGSAVSVDDALHLLSDYPEAVQLGKMCIIRSILKAEGGSRIRFDRDSGRVDPNAGREGWIEQIFSMAITGYKLSQVASAFQKITFVNFNYDRCIEHYLFWSLQRIGIPEQDAQEIVDNLNIIRPYGTLGSILGGPSFLKFGEPRPPNLFDMISRIRTFTESEAMHDTDKLSQTLSDAAMVIFLGFGFHPQNLRLLARDKDTPVRRTKVLATVFGLNDANLSELKLAIARHLRFDTTHIETHPMTASEVLQKLRLKIVMGVG